MISNKNIVLTGFMGTGKSTIGSLLAQRLNRRFVDMDSELEASFGKPIARVFAEEGEAAFRTAESKLCADLAREQGLVISTGGGALVNAQNRATLAEMGILLCLNASADEILRRVAHYEDRPLLAGSYDDKRTKIKNLLRQRRPAYSAILHQIETTGRTPDEILALIEDALAAEAELPGMKRISVRNPEGSYHICLGEGLLAHAGSLLRNRKLRPGATALVTNDKMPSQHVETLRRSLQDAGYEVTLCLVPEGEEHKTLATVSTLYDQFIAAKLDRKSPVISLGGGVIGDMAGFAAATYLRGVPYVQIPTSLLSMVDASVGGKVGVDLPQGKNLVGAFKQPQVVIIDTAVLETLPAAEFRSGMAEVVKHGLITQSDLFEQLENEGPANLTQLVADAVQVKVKIVEEDPYEEGRRALLNLGHTFGHAVEQASEYAIRHGEAVAIGMVAAMRMAVDLGRCDTALAERTEKLLERLGLPTFATELNLEQVLAIMGTDKKRAGKKLRFIIAQGLGDVVIIDDPGSDYVRRALASVLKN
ncbi:MAG: 3-dehydroquinate synthase [Caldilineaceae bacterium]